MVIRFSAIYSPSMSFFSSMGLALVMGFGGQAVLAGQMTVGQLTGFLLLVGFLYEPTGQLHSLNQLLQSGRAAGERIFEIMDEQPEKESVDADKYAEIIGDVRFKNVSFAYSKNLPVLNNIDLHARVGETVALVGYTGAGKSTLVNLLTGFYECNSGEILIDGKPLRELSKAVVRSSIGMVTQESFLFNVSVRDNLRLGKPDASDAELWNALQSANARSFVERFPEHLETVVGERGVKLSVGEKQRISIARALLKNAPILILDEATASVDTETESLIHEALDRLMTGRTSFVIAHRLSTVRHADQILVMERGRIVERGRHDELLSRCGVYARLCENSFLGPGQNPVRRC